MTAQTSLIYFLVAALFVLRFNDHVAGRGLFYVWNKRGYGGTLPRLFTEIPGNTLVNHSACLERCMNTTGCTATTSCTKPWGGNGCWKVPEPLPNRQPADCKHSAKLDNNLINLYIRVGNSASKISENSLCKSTPLNITGDTEQSVSCDQTAVGRYIFLQLNNTIDRVLAVCEIMVKGYKFVECTRGSRGITCEEDCSDTCPKDLPQISKIPWNVSVTSSSVSLAWNRWAAGNTGSGVGPVTKYIIQYKEENTQRWLSKIVNAQTQNGNNVEKNIEGLQYNTYYLFRVACFLTDGLGDVNGKFTGSIRIKTACQAPKAIPQSDIRVTSTLVGTSEATMTISWSAVSDANSGCDLIKKYKVKYKKNDSTVYMEKIVNGNTQYSINIEDVSVYTEYDIIVETYNNEEKMSASNLISYTTVQGKSEAVRQLHVTSPAPNQLSVTWAAPTKPRGMITGYKLQYRQVGIADCDNEVGLWSQNVTKGANDVAYIFERLYPFRKYQVRIFPVNSAGDGKEYTVEGLTKQSEPSGAPQNVEVSEKRKRAATLKWNEVQCEKRNGIVTNYVYQIKGVQYSTIDKRVYTNFTALSAEIASLTPYALYTVKVAAATEAGPGTSYSDEVTFRTQEDVPPAPRKVMIPGSGQTSLYVDWTTPYPPHGVILDYEIEYNKEGDSMNRTTDNNLTKFRIEDLETSVNYSVRVRAKSNAGWGVWSAKVFGFTEEGVPSKPLSFNLARRTTSSLSFSWTEPKYPNGVITGYKLECNEPTLREGVSDTFRETTLDGLSSETLYVCSILAKTSAGYGNPSVEILAWTLPNPPKPPPFDPVEEPMITDSTITFQAPVFNDDRIKNYEVHIDKDDSTRNRRAVLDQSATNFTGCDKNPSQRDAYITAKLKPDQAKGTFTVGDGKMYGGYWNCPLIKDSTYSIFYAAVVESLNGEKARTFVIIGRYKAAASQNWVTILCACLGVLAAIAIIAIVAVFIRRRRQKDFPGAQLNLFKSWKRKKEGDKTNEAINLAIRGPGIEDADDNSDTEEETNDIYENSPSKPQSFHVTLPASNLLPSIKKKRKNKNAEFKKEYESLPSGLQKSIAHTFGSKPENRVKNRFVNIMAYDHSRVVLEKFPDDPDSDYINAAYIDGYKMPKKFIACQGANKAMTSDIWRMIWQYSINRIVMVTNLVEKGVRKCDPYWPGEGEEDHVYAGIKVHLENSEILSDFTVRTFIISKDEEMKTVWQFHYTAWPDHGVPDHATSLLSFRRKVRSYDNMTRGPTVVHCSAGVGRTGTFIALDYLLEQAKAENQVTIYTYVDYMRQQRVNMIQTLDQYIFLYNAIFEGVRCGDTVVTPPQFLQFYEEITKIDPETSQSKLSEQYRLLLSMRLTIDPDSQAAGKSPENINKNRSLDILPVNVQRPFLSTPVPNCTDFINATYINGYKQKDAFIVTQMPFLHTVVDLYRLLLEHQSNCVVMLNPIDKNDEETEIKRDIKHFQLRDWPVNAEAPSAGTLLNLLDQVERWQQQSGSGPVTVHCYDGASQSGVFVAVSYILEKLKLEQEIDIFNAVRYIQTSRPQLIGSEAQYRFCHEAVVEYLKSFDTYSNFQ